MTRTTTDSAIAQRFRLNVTDLIQAQPNGSTDTLWFLNGYYSVSQADRDFSPVYKVLPEQIQAAPFPTLYNTYTAVGQMLDRMSLYQWIENYLAGGHSSPMGAYLDSAYVNEYGLDGSQQSSLNLVYLLGFQSRPGNMSIYGKSNEPYHIDGGNQQPARHRSESAGGKHPRGWR